MLQRIFSELRNDDNKKQLNNKKIEHYDEDET